MAFGDRKIKFVGPMCDTEGCQKPKYMDGLCADCYRGQTPSERRTRAGTAPLTSELIEQQQLSALDNFEASAVLMWLDLDNLLGSQ
jgi:hypothetical protein